MKTALVSFGLLLCSLVLNTGFAVAQNSFEDKNQLNEKPLHRSVITAETAKKIASAAEHAALKEGFSIVVSIVDNHGNLKYFNRMDNTAAGSIEVSQLKAFTSAKFPVSSKTLSVRSDQLPANPYASIPGMLLLEGGLPITNESGEHVGGIGVSGATPELDAKFAQAGIDQYH